MDEKFLKAKESIIKKLNKLGWKYVVDEFTCSDRGHRREHFQRLDVTEFEDGYKIATLNYVLIFHYLDHSTNIEDDCTIQMSRMIGDYEEIMVYYKEVCYGFYPTRPDVSLNAEEMDLFTKFMKLIDKHNKEASNE